MEQNGNLLLSNHIVLSLTTDTSFLKTSTQVQTSVKGSMKMALEKGEVIKCHDGCILGIKWMDKRVVSPLSTIDDNSMVGILRRTSACREGIEIIQKSAIIGQS